MTAVAFDTHAAVKKLQSAGFTEAQAEAQADLLAAALKSGIADLATKADLDALRMATKADLDAATARLEARLNVLEERNSGRFRLLYWMFGFNLALSAAMLWALIRISAMPGLP